MSDVKIPWRTFCLYWCRKRMSFSGECFHGPPFLANVPTRKKTCPIWLKYGVPREEGKANG